MDTRLDHYSAEIETFVFINALGPHQGWSFYMRNILSKEASGSELSQLQSRAKSLACTVLTLHCILSVVEVEALSQPLDRRATTSLAYSLRDTFVSRLSEFLKSYIDCSMTFSIRQRGQAETIRPSHISMVLPACPELRSRSCR